MSRAVPRLHLISDRALCPLDRFPKVARATIEAGVDAVHLREKDLPGGLLLQTARALRQVAGRRAAVIVNERVDVALVSDADGVQLGEDALSSLDVRRLDRGRLLVGRSVHDARSAAQAALDGADFVLAGHIYESPSKPGQPPRGPAFIAEIARACRLPIIGIGGITPERVAEVVDAGAHGVAVISGILAADDPAAAARRYRAALDAATHAGEGH